MVTNAIEINKNRLFESVSKEVIDNYIMPKGKIVSFTQGETIYAPLDKVNTIQILLYGKVKLVYYMSNGDQDIKNLLLPGNLIGIDLVCTRTQLSPYQAVASDKCEIFTFPADVVLEPGFMPEKERLCCIRNLLLIISHVNMQNEYRLAILTRNSLHERIMVYLTMQANRNQSNTFTIPFTREEMSSYLRVNRSALSHELSLMRKKGIIDFKKNTFTLLKGERYEFDDINIF